MGISAGQHRYNMGKSNVPVEKWIMSGQNDTGYATANVIALKDLPRFSTNPPSLLLLLLSFIYNPLGKGV